MQLYPESDTDFFLRDFNTSFHFDNNILTVHEHGEDSQWKKK